MAGEDKELAFETIKDSYGMTDDDFKPTTQDRDLDLGDDNDEEDAGDDDTSSESQTDDGDLSEEDSPPQRQEAREPERRAPEGVQKPAKKDDLRRREPLAFNPRALPKMDAKGNVVDPRTGEILARAGSEARIFNRVHKQAMDYVRTAGGHFQNRLHDTNSRLNKAVDIGLKLEQELSSLREQNAAIAAFGLEQSELVQAAQMVKQSKTDPVGVLKYLLTQAAVRGIDVQQLGLQPGSVDPKSLTEIIQGEIAKATRPIHEQTQAQRRQAEQAQARQAEDDQAWDTAVTFFNSNPTARQYMPVFKRVLENPQNANMPLGEIWAKLQLHLMRRGIDPAKGPSNGQRRELQREDTRQQQRRSLPSSRGMTRFGDDGQDERAAGPAPVSQSYDDIIRDVLKRNPTRRAV